MDTNFKIDLKLILIYKNKKVSDKMKFIDLCSGIGGFHYGLKNHTCVMACDIDKKCREVYKINHKIECKDDIFDIKSENITDFNILCAGFPCQPFSAAGLKKGMGDNRSKVYDKILDIISKKNPEIILLENVKNLILMNKGEIMKQISSDLEKLNYSISYSILNTSNFGLPQNRERVYIVCINKRYKISKFNFTNLNLVNIKKYLKEVIDLDNKDYISEDKYILLDSKKVKTQPSGLIFCGYIKGNLRKNGVLPGTEHLSRVHKQPNRIYHINGVNPTLSSTESSGRYYIYDGKGVRKLTERECFKIMGFPENHILHEKKNTNFSQVGNSVSPVIIEKIQDELIFQGFI